MRSLVINGLRFSIVTMIFCLSFIQLYSQYPNNSRFFFPEGAGHKVDPVLRRAYAEYVKSKNTYRHFNQAQLSEKVINEMKHFEAVLPLKTIQDEIYVDVVIKTTKNSGLENEKSLENWVLVSGKEFDFHSGALSLKDLGKILNSRTTIKVEQLPEYREQILEGAANGEVDHVWKGGFPEDYTDNYVINGSGVTIGLIETGLPLLNHTFLTGISSTDCNLDPNANVTNHATGVAGVLVGQELSSGDRGIAPGAELYYGTTTNILSTIDNFRQKNQSNHLGRKPLVINMSFGYWSSPRDGTTLLEQALNEIVQDAIDTVILVTSAGNAMPAGTAEVSQHKYSIIPGDENFYDLPIKISNVNSEKNSYSFLLYYPSDDIEDFQLSFRVEEEDILFNSHSEECIFGNDMGIEWNNSGDDTIRLYNFDMTPNDPDYLGLDFSDQTNLHCLMVIFDKGPNGSFSNLDFNIQVRSNSFTGVGIPVDGYHSAITSPDKNWIGYESGDNRNSILTPGYADQVITVAAHMDTPFNQIAPFSSQGPSRLGILKPDITATGVNVLSSAVNLDPNSDIIMGNVFLVDWDGTSFSAPIVTGAIALLLQNIKLDEGEVKSLIKYWADKVYYDDWEFAWGDGRLDLLSVFKGLVGYNGDVENTIDEFVLGYANGCSIPCEKGIPTEKVVENWNEFSCDGNLKQELTNGALFYSSTVNENAVWIGQDIWDYWINEKGGCEWGLPLVSQFSDFENNEYATVVFNNNCKLFFNEQTNEVEEECGVLGCTDSNAHNYNPLANVDDGSCETCEDGIQNGDETDIDCGGANCLPCCPTDPPDIDEGSIATECEGGNYTYMVQLDFTGVEGHTYKLYTYPPTQVIQGATPENGPYTFSGVSAGQNVEIWVEDELNLKCNDFTVVSFPECVGPCTLDGVEISITEFNCPYDWVRIYFEADQDLEYEASTGDGIWWTVASHGNTNEISFTGNPELITVTLREKLNPSCNGTLSDYQIDCDLYCEPIETTLLLPEDNGLRGIGQVVQFSWDSNGPETGVCSLQDYDLWVDDNSSFSSPNTYVISTNTFYNSYQTTGTYYWKVRATNMENGTGNWSPVRSFEIQEMDPPMDMDLLAGDDFQYSFPLCEGEEAHFSCTIINPNTWEWNGSLFVSIRPTTYHSKKWRSS